MTDYTSGVFILDIETNTQVPAESIIATASPKIAKQLQSAVTKIVSSGELRLPTAHADGPGRWVYELVNDQNVLQRFYLGHAAIPAAAIPTMEISRTTRNADGSESGIALITSGEFTGKKVKFARAGADSPREDNGYASYRFIQDDPQQR